MQRNITPESNRPPKGVTGRRVAVLLAAASSFLAIAFANAPAVLVMEFEAVLDIVPQQDRPIRPVAVSCDPYRGDICITDAQYSRFHVINRRGVEEFVTGDFSGLSSPLDGSLTRNGDFVFIDRNGDRVVTIRRLNFMGEPTGYCVKAPIEEWEPRHLSIARDNNLLALDSYHGVLSKHDSETGELLWSTQVAADGSMDLQLGRPVESADNRIYVPCGMHHNVIVISSEGEREQSFGEFGSGPGKMTFPVGAALGPEETILILDRMRHKVMVFDTDHRLLGDFGSMGAGQGQFYHPSAIAASDDGKVYVAQGYESRVQVFRIRDTRAQ